MSAKHATCVTIVAYPLFTLEIKVGHQKLLYQVFAHIPVVTACNGCDTKLVPPCTFAIEALPVELCYRAKPFHNILHEDLILKCQ